MGKHGPRKCPWTSSKKRKKRRTNDDTVMRDEAKANLAASDLGSYFQKWSDDTSSDSEVEKPIGSSRQKIETRHGEGSVKIWDLKTDDTGSESDTFDESDTEESPDSLNIIDSKLLEDALKESAICRDCKTGELQLVKDESSRNGQGQIWILQCKRVDCKFHKNPKRFHTSQKSSRFYEINRAIVLAFRAIGRGYSAAQKVCSILNLPNPVCKKPWSRHTQGILKAAETLLEEELTDAAFEVKKLLRDVGDIEDCTDEELKEKIVPIGASFDGSWSSRGSSARDGIVAAISVDTGKVVDVVYMNGSCSECIKMEEKRSTGKISRREFLEWYLGHDDDCFLNHDGSAASMEAEGALKIYLRSEDKRKLQYNPYVGDGDSKSFARVQHAKPYGPMVELEKEECIAHVTKRMGANLRATVQKYKGQKLADGKGIGGKGRLTNARIDTMQNFYGMALRRNKGNAKEMARATRAILKHYTSTPENPQHEDCPPGKNSWCSYQKDIACKTNTHQPIKDPIPSAVVEVIQPVFDKLSNESFLAACERCLSQNRNEALHHVTWALAPKEQFVSPQETYLAVCLSVLIFNAGHHSTYTRLCPAIGITVTPRMIMGWQQIDQDRMRGSDYKEQPTVKERRKKRKRQKVKKQDAFVHQEGTMYSSQAFHTS